MLYLMVLLPTPLWYQMSRTLILPRNTSKKNNTIFMSTGFIKREAGYRHNLMLAKQDLTCTSAQRTNNREKTETRPTKTNGHRTSRTTTAEQKRKPHQPAKNIQVT